jgi:hypothetical protein
MLKTIGVTLIFVFSIISCNTSVNKSDLIGEFFKINDSYHEINFSSSSYEIYQNTTAGPSCVGNGSWSLNEGFIVLSRNNSSCSSTNRISGKFKIDDSGKWLERK